MYWLRAKFDIAGKEDLERLQKLYSRVMGELDYGEIKIEYTHNPFGALLKILEESNGKYTGTLTCRLDGPGSVRAASIDISTEKIDPTTFEHSEKETLLGWAQLMDQHMAFEMARRNDIGYQVEPLKTPLKSTKELFLAAKLTQHVTHVLPLEGGILVSNERAVYLVEIPLNSDFRCPPGIVFDSDDGYASVFTDELKGLEYPNKIFQAWKDSGYQRTLGERFKQDLEEVCIV